MKNLSTKFMMTAVIIGNFSQAALANDGSVRDVSIQGGARISVVITDVNVLSGDVRLGLYNSKMNYKHTQDFRSIDTTASANTVRLSFENLPAGEYGIRLFHDIDGNGEFGMNKFGIPTEPYAFSNNAKGLMGPAKWNRVKFNVNADETVVQTISLK